MLKFKVDVKGFEARLQKVIENKVKKALDKIGQNFLQVTYNLVASDVSSSSTGIGSPVFTGQFYNNHIVSINKQSNEVRKFDNLNRDNPLPFLPLNDAVLKSYNISNGDSAFIANNLGYAGLIEAGVASPKKAPRGVYKIAAEMAIVSYNARIK